MKSQCTSKPFIYQHPCGLWQLQHEGDECTESHAEYDTLLEALEASPHVTRIDM